MRTLALLGLLAQVVWKAFDRNLYQGVALSAAYVEKGEPGIIVYDVPWDRQRVRLANGHWTTGMTATSWGCEDARRQG